MEQKLSQLWLVHLHAGQDMTTGSDSEEVFEALLKLCELHQDCHVYVLLDRNCPVVDTHELHEAKLAKRAIQRLQVPVLRPDFAHEPETLPSLMLLRQADEHGWVDEELVRATVDCALQRCASVNGAYVAGWLLSQASPNDIARHLCSAGVVFDMGQGRTRYLPYFEPHALALVHAHSDATALPAWLGPVQCWGYVDLLGQLKALQLPKDVPVRTGAKPKPTAKLMAALSRRKLARSIAAHAGAQSLPPRQPEATLDDMIERAHAEGLSRTEDIVLHALNALAFGMHWSSHPLARQAIAKAAKGAEAPRLSDLLDALSDEQLNELAGAGDRRA